MKTTIDVESRREADLIKTALNDPITRAFVQVMGALLPLSHRDQIRVLNFVSDKLAEAKEEKVRV